jgi:hypothetical protein
MVKAMRGSFGIPHAPVAETVAPDRPPAGLAAVEDPEILPQQHQKPDTRRILVDRARLGRWDPGGDIDASGLPVLSVSAKGQTSRVPLIASPNCRRCRV